MPRNILAKTRPWMDLIGKDWRAIAFDTVVWGLAATFLYVLIFYAAMWVL